MCNSPLSKRLHNHTLIQILYSLSKNEISSEGVEPLIEDTETLKALQKLR